MATISLRLITPLNLAACARLQVADDQRAFVDPAWFTLMRGATAPFKNKAIYADETPVGLVRYGFQRHKGEKRWTISRIFIDYHYQGLGYGTQAMQILIEEARANPKIDAIWLRYEYNNHVAARLYRNLGFVETDEVIARSIVAKLSL